MMHCSRAATGFALVALWTTVTLGQSSPPASQPAEEKKAPPVERVAVTVNGHQIRKSELDGRCDAVLKAQAQGQVIPPRQLAQLREHLGPQILETLIDNRLLDDDVTKAQIKVTDTDLVGEMEELVRAHLVRTGATRAEFERRLQDQTGDTFQGVSGDASGRSELQAIRTPGKAFGEEIPEGGNRH